MAKSKSKSNVAYAQPDPRAVVVAVLDETGSMAIRREETVVAYNAYLEGLRNARDVDIYITTFKFDRFGTEPTCRPLNPEATLVRHAPQLTVQNYLPRGNTPLYDAIGLGIGEAERLGRIHGTERITLMVQTDGMENASTEFSYLRIKDLIAEKKYRGWQILFLGADLGERAYQTASGLGLARGMTMSYSSVNSSEAFASAAGATANYMSTGQSTGFSDEDKKKSGDTTSPTSSSD